MPSFTSEKMFKLFESCFSYIKQNSKNITEKTIVVILKLKVFLMLDNKDLIIKTQVQSASSWQCVFTTWG